MIKKMPHSADNALRCVATLSTCTCIVELNLWTLNGYEMSESENRFVEIFRSLPRPDRLVWTICIDFLSIVEFCRDWSVFTITGKWIADDDGLAWCVCVCDMRTCSWRWFRCVKFSWLMICEITKGLSGRKRGVGLQCSSAQLADYTICTIQTHTTHVRHIFQYHHFTIRSFHHQRWSCAWCITIGRTDKEADKMIEKERVLHTHILMKITIDDYLAR